MMPLEPDDLPDDRPASAQQADASQTSAASTQTTTPETPVAGQTTATPPATSPSAQTAPAATPAAATTPVSPASGATSTPTTPSFANIRDYAASLGIENAKQYGDDQSFTQALIALAQTRSQQLAEAQQMAKYGQLWLQQQQTQKPADATPADPLSTYKAPQFDPRWEQLIVRDAATGEVKLAPGADPAILPKFHAWRQHREDITNKLLADPVEFLKPIISHLVGQQGKELIEGRLGQLQEQQYTDGFISQNRAWLFAHDKAGVQIFNPANNKPILSPAGQRFHHHLTVAHDVLGIKGTEKQEFYARTAMAAETGAAHATTQQAVQTGQQQQQNVLNTMNRNPSPSGSLVGQDQTGHQAPANPNEGLSLREMLARDMKAAGITDEMIAAEDR